jgi:uncharacterized protein YuzE
MKKSEKIQVAYEPDADIVSMWWGALASIDHAEENGEVILHVNRKNEPVLVEILNASKVFQRPVLSTLKPNPAFARTRRTSRPTRKLVVA